MSSTATVLTDSSRLSRLDLWFFKVESLLNLIGGITIFFLVFLAVANALGRWFFNIPVSGYVDWVEQFMAVFAFAGLAYCQRLGGHIRMDMVLGFMKGRMLWFSEALSVAFMLFISLVLVYGSYLHFFRAFKNGDSSMDIGLPIWPAKLIVPVALSILSFRLLLQLLAYLRAFKNGTEQPVAVPLIEDAATVAAKEAESLDGGQDD